VVLDRALERARAELRIVAFAVELGATATDNCSLASLSTNGVVDADAPGTYFINYVAVDAAGNSARLLLALVTSAALV